MNKFLITAIIPTLELEFNIYIPNNKKIGTIKKYLLITIKELTGDVFYKTEGTTLLLERDSGKELDSNMYVKDSGIKNGSKIIIM